MRQKYGLSIQVVKPNEEASMAAKKSSRRKFLKSTLAASTVGLFGPYIHTAHAAGQLSVGFWDH